MVTLYLPIAAPVAAAVLALILPWRLAATIGLASAVAILSAGVSLALRADTGTVPTALPVYGNDLLRADALTAWMLIAIGAVATLATAAAFTYLRTDTRRERLRYLVLTQLFLACMAAAVLADNLGLLWIAVEATTIVTAFLVGHRRDRKAVEAAWKYVVLCSIGVAIAFLGTVCFYAASVAAGHDGFAALDWSQLSANARGLDPALVRLATGLVVLGFGTKAGLAPMHAWLPDAHSQAPAPVSALMSGVLLSVAFYAILRYKAIADVVLGPTYVRVLLLVAGLASLIVAALLLIAQRDYKRLLAYSSIEHMGLIALATAFGIKLAIAAALLHILGHGLAKGVAFCSAGRILDVTGSSAIERVRGLAGRRPALAATFGVSVLALLGLPPFSIFSSELGIARAGFASGLGWAVAIAFTLILLAFIAIVRHGIGMVLGDPPPPATEVLANAPEVPVHPVFVDDLPASPATASAVVATRGPRAPGLLILALGLAASAALGLYLGPLRPALDAAATIVAGSH